MNAAFWCRHKFDSQWLNAHRTTNKIKTFNNNNNPRVWTTKFIRSAYLSNAIIIISFLKWKRQAKRGKERNKFVIRVSTDKFEISQSLGPPLSGHLSTHQVKTCEARRSADTHSVWICQKAFGKASCEEQTYFTLGAQLSFVSATSICRSAQNGRAGPAKARHWLCVKPAKWII